VRPWAKAIKERVVTRQMPPWHLDKTVGIQQFVNDRSLTDQQIDTIVRWVDAGAPLGDPKDLPALKQWPNDEEWQLAKRFVPPEHRQIAPARLPDPLGHPHARRRGRHSGSCGVGRVSVSQGRGSEVPHALDDPRVSPR